MTTTTKQLQHWACALILLFTAFGKAHAKDRPPAAKKNPNVQIQPDSMPAADDDEIVQMRIDAAISKKEIEVLEEKMRSLESSNDRFMVFVSIFVALIATIGIYKYNKSIGAAESRFREQLGHYSEKLNSAHEKFIDIQKELLATEKELALVRKSAFEHADNKNERSKHRKNKELL
ncbi:MAG: hypothetical protein CFE23_11600 [Flavobacterium sp. BFFFF1]|uniref:hypothetical protein n=1 Tax=Flavobacterium sp. BFFFF1 TaxID=2015557 RepID=UPI000BD736A5|nr:hypothetical protein [Flavobacterium sp. BFFFF1]OYU79893.1 MAG: hypothetical protein CFE23_11600 [Flavobacterium sp. BFFFF1]